MLSAMKRLPPRKLIPLAAFALLMASAIPVNLVFLAKEGGQLGAIAGGFERFAKGRIAEEVTAKYNNSSPFRDFGIEAFGSLSYLAFNEARSGAQVGSDGMLFSNEEFETGKDTPARLARAVAFIAGVNESLAKRGIALVIAPLPLKADIEHARLGSHRLPPELLGRYAALRAALAKEKVASVDLRAAFLLARTEAPMFLRTDTHWTPDGARIAAQVLAGLASQLDLPGEKPFALKTGEAVEHRGDLLKFVRLLPAFEALGPQPDRLTPVTAEAPASDDLFEDAAIPVALVGTSYSANAAFGFEAHLKTALKRDVLNVAEEGKGPFAPMQAFLASDHLKTSPPKLVIWEMPVRYLDDAFDAKQFVLPEALP
jgi:alginate O-acetyltransferase complex protein AlgJ